MKITKILNNNTAIVLENNKETVIIGKGIAFKKQIGDLINPAMIEKKFCLSSNQLNTKFQEIIVSLPMGEIFIVEKIINEVKMNLGKHISDSIYVSLSDHIHFALNNFEKGILINNNLLYDIIKFYPDEYKLGKKGLEIIKEETGIMLPDDEAGFIALHIVNSETENAYGTDKIQQVTKLIEEIINIIRNYFNKEISEGTLSYYRFINHLRYFSLRVIGNATFNNDDNDEKLLEMMKQTYRDSYICAMNIRGFIKGKYELDFGNEELLYLIIHIQRAIYNQ